MSQAEKTQKRLFRLILNKPFIAFCDKCSVATDFARDHGHYLVRVQTSRGRWEPTFRGQYDIVTMVPGQTSSTDAEIGNHTLFSVYSIMCVVFLKQMEYIWRVSLPEREGDVFFAGIVTLQYHTTSKTCSSCMKRWFSRIQREGSLDAVLFCVWRRHSNRLNKQAINCSSLFDSWSRRDAFSFGRPLHSALGHLWSPLQLIRITHLLLGHPASPIALHCLYARIFLWHRLQRGLRWSLHAWWLALIDHLFQSVSYTL